MKKLIHYLLIGILSGFVLVSCDKKEDVVDEAIIDDVADDVASSLSTENSGLTAEFLEIVSYSDENLPENLKSTEADTLYKNDTILQKQNMAGAVYQYTYNYQMQYGFVFEGYENNYFYYYGSADGDLETPRMSSEVSRTSHWRLTGLEVSNASYELNGTTSRNATVQSKVRNKNHLSSQAGIEITEVKINKSTLQIQSGTLSYNYVGSMNQEQYQFSIMITYMGNGTAEMVINAKTYRVNLATGEIE